LVAVFRNMQPKGSGKRLYYLGGFFDPPDRRFPHLQALQQRLSTEYSDLRRITLAAPEGFEPPAQRGFAVELHSLSAQGGIFAGNIFARTLADTLGWTLRTFPQGGLEPNIQPVSFTILRADPNHAKKDVSPLMIQARPDLLDMVLVSGDRLIEELPSGTRIKPGGTIIVESNRSPRDLWLSISNRVVRWIEKHNLQVFMIDSRTIASETASRPSFVDQLTIWTLFGAYLSLGERLGDDDLKTFVGQFESQLAKRLGDNHHVIGDIVACVMAGTKRTVEINQQAFAADRKQTVVEPDPPWTVQNVSQHDRTVFDVNRFWHSVGYLYHSGEAKETLADPYLATGIMPAGSSAFRDMAPYRLRLPQWLPASCEACGLCWSVCPDSALPPSVNSIPRLLESAMGQAEKSGVAMVQMQRATDHLAKQIYKLVQKDDSNKYTELGPLFEDAFKQLTKKMGLTGDKLAPMQTEFDEIHRLVKHLPFSKTDEFFNNPHEKTKGSGSLLSIAQNPLSCSGCGLCIEVCPNGAWLWGDQTPELLDSKREAWRFQINLPGPDAEEIDPHITTEEPRTNVYRMLDSTAYHSMVGGDAAFPGNSVKTAVHLVTATIESVMGPRYQRHIDRLNKLIDDIEQRIQGKVTSTVKINDFEQFGRRLSRVGKKGLTADSLAEMLDDRGDREIDRAHLARLTALHNSLRQQRRMYVEGKTGTGRARMAVTVDPGGAAFWSGTYPYNPHQHPWISHLPGDGPALAEGVFDGLTRTLVDEFKLCRQAELEASGSYDPDEHDAFFQHFDAGDLNDDELDLIPPVLIISQSGMTSTREIGRMLRSRLPIRMIVINTEAVPTPDIATIGSPSSTRQMANSLGYLLLAQRDAFVLQSTVGHPGHLIQGVFEGLSQRCPAVFHIYAPDPQTNGIAPEKVTQQAALAFESRAFPLFKLDPVNGDAGLALDANPAPDANWAPAEIDVKEPSGAETSLDIPLTVAHWAFREARFQEHFRVVLKGELNDQMKRIDEYLELDPADRDGIDPFVDITDENDRHFLAIVSPAMTAAVEGQLVFWNYLRNLSAALARGARVDTAPQPSAPPPAAPQEAPPPIVAASMREQITESLLHLCGYGRDPEFFNQTLGQFLERDKGPATVEKTGDD
ncbi:MAG: 4Fe-4S binding protein, partial [Candidatus Latescibacterota bacterium]